MLYVTTRNDRDVYTASHALNKTRAEDGGAYVPFKMPRFDRDELLELSFNQCMAKVLNLLFGSKLSGWDLDFAIGRRPVRLRAMPHRIAVGQLWHNPDWHFDRMCTDVLNLLRKDAPEAVRSEWGEIGVRIAALVGLFGELLRTGGFDSQTLLDVAVPMNDFSGVMAALYTREFGLPVGNIVVVCNENAGLWDLINRGELRTGNVAIPTGTPLCDQIIPRNLERLIFASGGVKEVQRYLAACGSGSVYYPGNDVLSHMKKGIHIRVVGEKRMLSAIPNVFATTNQILGPYDALAYSGVLDHRAATGENRPVLILSDRSASCDADVVAAAMGLTNEQLLLQLRQN